MRSPLVRDDVLGTMSGSSHDALHEGSHRFRIGRSSGDRKPHDAARVLVRHDGHPPAKRPSRRERKGTDRCPSTPRRRHDRHVRMPDVMWALRDDLLGRLPTDRTHGRNPDLQPGLGREPSIAERCGSRNPSYDALSRLLHGGPTRWSTVDGRDVVTPAGEGVLGVAVDVFVELDLHEVLTRGTILSVASLAP